MQEIRYMSKLHGIERELRAIEEEELVKRIQIEDRVILNFNKKLFKSLKKIVRKITKAS